MWHNILHYGLIALVAVWIITFAVSCFVDLKTAAGASMAPILLAFVVIALIAGADQRLYRRQKYAWHRRIVLLAVVAVAAAIYWQTPLLNSLHGFFNTW